MLLFHLSRSLAFHNLSSCLEWRLKLTSLLSFTPQFSPVLLSIQLLSPTATLLPVSSSPAFELSLNSPLYSSSPAFLSLSSSTTTLQVSPILLTPEWLTIPSLSHLLVSHFQLHYTRPSLFYSSTVAFQLFPVLRLSCTSTSKLLLNIHVLNLKYKAGC